MSGLEGARCVGQHELRRGFSVHKFATLMCTITGQLSTDSRRHPGRLSTDNSLVVHSSVDDHLPVVGSARDNVYKDTTNASRPRTKGVGAPVQGLADRKDTTDS